MKSNTMLARRLLWILLVTPMTLGQNQNQEPLQVRPGDTITVMVPGLNANDKVLVTLSPVSSPTEAAPQCGKQDIRPSAITITGPNTTNLSLAVPPTACPGLYQIAISRAQAGGNG
jgi:protein involved in polysaccharide export with SLBB domain